MPKRVDHEERRRHIAAAVCRITVRGGLQAATFREIAAEAGVSVRLVQYYFGTKDELLLATQRFVASRSVARIQAMARAADPGPRHQLRAVLGSFIPVDAESRENMLAFIALGAAALADPSLAHRDLPEVPNSLQHAVRDLLGRCRLRSGVDASLQASILVALVPGLAQGVLDGSFTAAKAKELLDHAIDRAVLR